MFANTTKLQVASARQAASSLVRPAHSNDNTMMARAGGPRPIRRPKLVCRWRPMIGGGLECRWDIEAVDGAATGGPDQRWIAGSAGVLPASSVSATRAGETPALPGVDVGRGRTAGQLAMLAAG
jgi:hypothetical protein